MKTSCILCLTILTYHQSESANLDSIQQKLIFSLSNSLVSRHCVIVSDTNSDYFYLIKHSSEFNILTTVMSPSQFNSSMFYFGRWFRSRSMVIIDVHNTTHFLFKYFNTKSEVYLSKLIWVTFQPGEWSQPQFEGNIYIPYSCQFLLIMPTSDTSYSITELYTPRRFFKKLYYRSFGTWSTDFGLNRYAEDFYERRMDLNGVQLGMLATYGHGNCIRPGTCAYEEMITEMSRMMNFSILTMSWAEVEDDIEIKTGIVWEALIMQTIFDSVNFKTDMVAPIWKTPAFLHIAHTSAYERGYTSFYQRPLTSRMWYAVFFWILVSSACVLLIDYCNNSRTTFGRYKSFDIINSCFRSLDSISNQCVGDVSPSNSVRIAALMTRILAAVLYPAYSATIISFITVTFINLPFTDLEGLMKDGTFKIGYENGTVISDFFYISNDSLLKSAATQFLLHLDEMPHTRSDCLQRLCTDRKFALVYFNNDLFLSKSPCRLLQIPKPVYVSWDAYYLRGSSPYRVIFNRILKTFFSAGILKKMEKKVYGLNPQVSDGSQESNVDAVEMETLLPALKLLAAAYAVSTVMLLLEWSYKSLQTIILKNY